MLKIKLQPTKKKYQYKIVIINKKKKVLSNPMEVLGYLILKKKKYLLYPLKHKKVKFIQLDLQKLYYWLSMGVTITPFLKKTFYKLKVF